MDNSVDMMQIGKHTFMRHGKTYVMGILNVTPDSFSDGGKWNDVDRALAHVEEMLKDGMDILDIGGESTRPGYTMVSEEEEIQRVVPVIKAVKSRFDIAISLDTYKSKVAEAGIQAGADMINDIWGLKYSGDMAEVIARGGVACCLTHNRKEAVYTDFMQELAADLMESIQLAEKAGIADNQIILDPGVGFGKTNAQNLEVLNCLEQLNMFGYPVLLGCSRKSVVGETLDLPVEERLEGTLVTTVLGVMKGCSFVRVHDVKENVRAVHMAEAIFNSCKKGLW